MNKVVPSVMCFDMLNLKTQIKQLDDAGVDMYHVDIMDGHYVPNHALNSDIVRTLKKVTDVPIDVHLMVTNPTDYIESYADAGADYIIMHVETLKHPIRALKKVQALGIKAGLAVSPATCIDGFKYMIDFIDIVCVMTIDPGFAGQTLIRSSYGKIQELRRIFDEAGKDIEIMVDGQVKESTAQKLVDAGASVLVVGNSGLFSYPPEEYKQVVEMYQKLKRCGE